MYLGQYFLFGINLLNVLILLFLFNIYLKNYRHIKSKFTIGLLVFSVIFLIENIVFLALDFLISPVFEFEDLFLIMLVNIIELLGLSVLLYITWE